jgi:hypothetical protein
MKEADIKFDPDADDSDIDGEGSSFEDNDEDVCRDKNTAAWFKSREHQLSEAPWLPYNVFGCFYMFVQICYVCVHCLYAFESSHTWT